MNRTLKLLVVFLMLAIVPIRALAAVTIGFCAMEATSPASVDGGHGGHHGDDAPPQGEPSHDACNACVEHCANAALVALPAALRVPTFGAMRISSGETFAAGFIPEHLDPPPLAA